MKFSSINSYALQCTAKELEAVFNEMKRKYPNGFTCTFLELNSKFQEIRKRSKYTGYDVRTYSKNLLLQKFKNMGLIFYSHSKGKWVFLSRTSSLNSSPAEQVMEQMRVLDRQLVALGYSKTQRAIYKKKIVTTSYCKFNL